MIYARMVKAVILPGKLNEAIQLWEESVAPTTQELEGFINSRLYVNRETNRVCTSSLWESEADFQASVAWSQTQIEKFAALFAEPPVIDSYELATDVNSTLRTRAQSSDKPE